MNYAKLQDMGLQLSGGYKICNSVLENNCEQDFGLGARWKWSVALSASSLVKYPVNCRVLP